MKGKRFQSAIDKSAISEFSIQHLPLEFSLDLPARVLGGERVVLMNAGAGVANAFVEGDQAGLIVNPWRLGDFERVAQFVSNERNHVVRSRMSAHLDAQVAGPLRTGGEQQPTDD